MHESANGEHLSSNNARRVKYSEKFFTILQKAWMKHHLNILQAIVINTQRPTLCRQRRLKYKLEISGELLTGSEVQLIFSFFFCLFSILRSFFFFKFISFILPTTNFEETLVERRQSFILVLIDFERY